MAARKAAPKSNGNGSAVVMPFKYRSIGDIEKKGVLNIKRGELEQQHFAIEMQIEVLEEQPLESAEGAAEQRQQFISQLREQQAIIENMVRSYNERIADIDAALVADKEE